MLYRTTRKKKNKIDCRILYEKVDVIYTLQTSGEIALKAKKNKNKRVQCT